MDAKSAEFSHDHHADLTSIPNCPASLIGLIMDYHRAHSNSLRYAHAVSSNQPVSSLCMLNKWHAEYFQHVHVSNSDSAELKTVRDRLGEWYTSNWWKGRFSFSHTKPGHLEETAVAGSVDLVTLMMNVHNIEDIDAVIESAANLLTPNGTLAVVATSPVWRVVDNKTISDPVEQLFAGLGQRLLTVNPRLLEKLNSPLYYVPLPETHFIQGVTKRIRINFGDHEDKVYAFPGTQDHVPSSRVHPDHRLYAYNSNDPEGSGWRKEVKIEWLRTMMSEIIKQYDLDNCEPLLENLEVMIAEYSGSTITVEGAAVVLLGTHK